MDLDDIIKQHQARLRESIPFQTAAKAAAKALSDSCFNSMMGSQRRIASEAIASLAKSPGFQNTLASITSSYSSVARKVAEMTAPGLTAQIANLTTEFPGSAFSGLIENVYKQQQELTPEMISEITAPDRFSDEPFITFAQRSLRPVAPLVVPPRRETATEEFMRRLKEHLESGEAQAAESGGKVVVMCKAPGGEEILVQQLSTKDEHFITVIGIDQYKQRREFTGHHSAIGLSIEVVFPGMGATAAEDAEAIN